MSIAFVFPGQGSQRVGMGRALAEVIPESRAVFDEADATLGESLSGLCFSGPEDELQLTANTQPAILTASVAALRALEAHGCRPDVVAGHSLGEYSAMVAAGVLSIGDAVRTVRLRGQLMQEAVPVGVGAMAAILGLGFDAVQDACREVRDSQVVAPANINSPGQIVIAGHAEAVDRAIDACKARGAKRGVRLPVSAPFHCSLMMPAQEGLSKYLGGIDFSDATIDVVNNVDAVAVRDAVACREGLVRQVSSPVRWQESVERMASEGVDTFVEVGPGTVLTGLIKKIVKGARVVSVDDPASLEAALAALSVGAPA